MSSTIEELKKLKGLFEKGYLAKEEYERKRLQLINQKTKTTYVAVKSKNTKRFFLFPFHNFNPNPNSNQRSLNQK